MPRRCPASQSPGSSLHVKQAGGQRSPVSPKPCDGEQARAAPGAAGEWPENPASSPARARLRGVNPPTPRGSIPPRGETAAPPVPVTPPVMLAGDAAAAGTSRPAPRPSSRADGGSASARGRGPHGRAGPGAGGRQPGPHCAGGGGSAPGAQRGQCRRREKNKFDWQ